MMLARLFQRTLTLCTIFTFCFICYVAANSTNEKDPFQSLGIPDLNPKQLLAELDQDKKKDSSTNQLPQLKTIEDLPNFLKNSKLNEEEAISILTRFLIQDDYTLKKYGVVYDQSGFDGITSGERIAPVGTEERLIQRARSAANIWFKDKYPKLDYDAYGAENLLDEIVPNWRSYKVLMIGKNGENTFVKICLPLDESETALCSDKDELCGPKAEYVGKEKKKNEDYISRIRSGNFFKKKPKNDKVRLLPGEKIKAKEKNKEIILDSTTINYKLGENTPLFNPPSLDSSNSGDSLLNAFKNKGGGNLNNRFGNMNIGNFFPSIPAPQMQFMPNIPGFSPMNMFNQPYQVPRSQFGIGMNLVMPPNTNAQPHTNPQQAYNFKQKEPAKKPTAVHPPIPSKANSNSQVPHIDNSQIMNDLMQMKAQLSQMMNSLKQKDEIINQQNMKLASIGFQNIVTSNPTQMNMNGINMSNLGPGMTLVPNSQGVNSSMNQGLNARENGGMTSGFNFPGMNPLITQGMNVGMGSGFNPQIGQGLNPMMNEAMNPNFLAQPRI